jgi:ribosomal protein S6
MLTENKQYEISYLVRTEADKNAVLKVLQDINAENVVEGKLAEIRLTYPVKKQTSALFGFTVFEANPELIAKINPLLKFAEGVLRFLIVTPPPKKSQPRFSDRGRAETQVKTENENIGQIDSESSLPNLSSENKSEVDDAAFDEKLEEILTNTKDESK